MTRDRNEREGNDGGQKWERGKWWGPDMGEGEWWESDMREGKWLKPEMGEGGMMRARNEIRSMTAEEGGM